MAVLFKRILSQKQVKSFLELQFKNKIDFIKVFYHSVHYGEYNSEEKKIINLMETMNKK